MKHLILTALICINFSFLSQNMICAQEPEQKCKEIQFSSSTNKSTAKFPRKPVQIPVHGVLTDNEIIIYSFIETNALITVTDNLGSIIINEDAYIIDQYIVTLPDNCNSGSITVTINSIDFHATF